MLVPIALILAFVAVVLGLLTAADVMFSARDRNQRVNRRLTLLDQGLSRDEVYTTLVRKDAPVAAGQAKADLLDRFSLFCRQAGLTISPQRLVVFVLLGAVLLWAVGLVLLSVLTGEAGLLNATISLLGALMLGIAGAFVWVNNRRNTRLKKLEAQLPLALDIVTRALRAGHPVISAVQLAAQEMGDPIGSEFGLIVDETTYGLDFKDALFNFAHRTGSPDAHYFAVSVGIQAETGGNLAEILASLASVIRERQTLYLRVRALSSEGRMSAQVLSALPLFMIAYFMLTRPNYYSSKFADPIFWPAVGVVIVLYVTGLFIMNRIINFKY